MAELDLTDEDAVMQAPVGDLFPRKMAEYGVTETPHLLTEKQKAVLEFIVENPRASFDQLTTDCSVSASYAVGIVLEYGAKSEHYDRLRTIRQTVRSSPLTE